MNCNKCDRTHPSVLHIGDMERATTKGMDFVQLMTSEGCSTSSACDLTGAGHRSGILPILPVKVKSSKGSPVIETYAFLDPGSTGTLCSERLINRLNIGGRKAKIHLRTMGHSKTVESFIVDRLEISGFSGEN